MTALRAEGGTYRAVAAALNAEGIEPPARREWHAATIRKVLLWEERAAEG